MCPMTMLWPPMDHIYHGGPIRLPEGKGGRAERGKGVNEMVTEGEETLGGGHTGDHTDVTL